MTSEYAQVLASLIGISATAGGAAYGAHNSKKHPARDAAIGSVVGGLSAATVMWLLGYVAPVQVGTGSPPQLRVGFP